MIKSGQWDLSQGANAELKGAVLTAGMTLIRHTNGSVIEEGVFLGTAETGGNTHLVVGQMNLECVTILPDKVESTEDRWFSKIFLLTNEKFLNIAWDNLGHAVGLGSTPYTHTNIVITLACV